MMEFNNMENALNRGVFDTYEDLQGFHFGAKTNTYSPNYSYIKNEAGNNWRESCDLFGDEFNAFEDVILPNQVTFTPDDLLNHLDLTDSAINDSLVSNLEPLEPINGITKKETLNEVVCEFDGNDIIIPADQISSDIIIPEDQINSAFTIPENDFQSNIIPINPIETQPILFLDSNGQITTENNALTINVNVEEPVQNNITINLKTVKLPGKSQQKNKGSKSSEFPLSSTSKVIKKADSPKHSSVAAAPSSPLSKMTLKEALEYGCADDILNELLDMVSPTAPSGTRSKLLDEVTSCIADPSTSYDSDITSGSESPLTSGSETGFSPMYDPTFSPVDMTSFPEDSDSDFHMSESEPKKKGRRPKLTAEEKKLKKMEQNKRAATRYRQKKKKEEMEVHDRLKQEEERHKNLTGQYKQLKQEIKVMKKMMRELFIAKGIVSAEDFNK